MVVIAPIICMAVLALVGAVLASRNIVVNMKKATNSALSPEQYKLIDEALSIPVTTETIGRKLFGVDTQGPLGLGRQTYTYDRLTEMSAADLALQFIENFDGVDKTRYNVPIPKLQKHFRIELANLESSKTYGESLDVTEAAAAGRKIAELEDDLLLVGSGGINGLYDGAGNGPEGTALGFDVPGNPIAKVRLCLALLRADNIPGPFNMVLNHTQWDELMSSIYGNQMEANVVKQMLGGEIYQSTRITTGRGIICNVAGKKFFELIIAADLTSIEEAHALHSEFFNYEAMVPVIKEANSICSFTGA